MAVPRTAFCGHGVGRLFHGPPDVPWPRLSHKGGQGCQGATARKGDRHNRHKKKQQNVVYQKWDLFVVYHDLGTESG